MAGHGGSVGTGGGSGGGNKGSGGMAGGAAGTGRAPAAPGDSRRACSATAARATRTASKAAARAGSAATIDCTGTCQTCDSSGNSCTSCRDRAGSARRLPRHGRGELRLQRHRVQRRGSLQSLRDEPSATPRPNVQRHGRFGDPVFRLQWARQLQSELAGELQRFPLSVERLLEDLRGRHGLRHGRILRRRDLRRAEPKPGRQRRSSSTGRQTGGRRSPMAPGSPCRRLPTAARTRPSRRPARRST